MSKLRILTLFALFFGAFGIASADTLQMEGVSASADSSRPTRGMTAASVESRFGAPDAKRAAVGDPPSSSWEYKNFVVFFEYDRVIHAVVKRQKAS
jgi:hypothetical protein